MTTVDYETELEAVNEAITKVITGGHDVSYNGRRVVRTDLPELRKHRNHLLSQIEKAQRGGIRVRGGTPIG